MHGKCLYVLSIKYNIDSGLADLYQEIYIAVNVVVIKI